LKLEREIHDIPTAVEVRAALDQIIASDDFRRSVQLATFLRFVVEATLRGEGGRIKGYTIATEAFRRGDGFDPQTDPIVRVEAARLRRAIGRYYAGPGAMDSVVIELPRRGYIPTFRRRRVDQEMRVRLNGAAEKAAPVLALPNKPSIAVMAFQNMSGAPEQDYFADGMVEDIITALSRMRWLFVIARNSTFTYKGRAVDVKQVGRELGVRYVLEGSVRKWRTGCASARSSSMPRPDYIYGRTASRVRSTMSSICRTR